MATVINAKNKALADKVVETLKTVFDPEIPVNIYELGLVYNIDIDENNNVKIDMTLTAPTCPIAGDIVEEVNDKVRQIEGVGKVEVNLTFDPPWDMSMMSLEAKLELGFM